MISEVNRALFEYFSQLGYPVYLQGFVPANEQGQLQVRYPFLTLNLQSGGALSTGIVTVFNWHNGENAQRISVMDKLALAVPEQGVTIHLDGGCLLLHRNTSFQTYYDDPTDKNIIGGRTSCLCNFYTL